MERWNITELKDLAYDITVGHVGTMANEYCDGGIVFLRSQNVVPYKILLDDVKFISQMFHKKLKKSTLNPGDVVIVRTGKPGASAVIPESLPISNCSDLVIVRPGKDLDSRFLCYYINSVASHYVNSQLVGAVQQHFNVSSTRSLKINLPPINEQKGIARILGTLDDKIELNRKMNENLEAMARAIFKSWFVDFDPVRAKMDGRQPAGMNTETAALFPDSFEDSPFGKIPKGWKVGRLSEIIEIIGGGTPKTKTEEYWNGNIPWFSVVDAPADSGVFVIDTEKKITQAGLNNSSTRLLPLNTTIISARGTVGKCALVGTPMAFNQSCYGIRPIKGNGEFFTYFLMRQSVSELQQGGHGSVFNTITRDTFDSLKMCITHSKISMQFDHIIRYLMDQMKCNLFESASLASIRDILLPKLLSGEIRVEEVEAP